MANTVPLRSEIDEQYTWNAPSVFESAAAWEAAFSAVKQRLPDLAQYQGRLDEGPETLVAVLDLMESLMRETGKVYVYALMSREVDTTDQEAGGMLSRSQGLMGHVMATISFIDPELLAIGQETFQAWMEEDPRLAVMAHYIDDLFRKQTHVRSAEIEAIFGQLMSPFSGVSTAASVLTNADFDFEPAVDSAGETHPVTQGTLRKLYVNPDREVRRTAWEHYTDRHLDYKNTLATLLDTSIKQNVFGARARRYESTLEAALFEHNIPVAVFENLIETFRKHLPTWHRYWALRRKVLGVETLHPYDVWAPLSTDRPEVPYEQAVEWIGAGLAPMGADYVEVVRAGALSDRWVDVYPNQGKRAGAFSAGWPGTYPFILMSYNDDVLSLSTLAHELGHSMHSYLAWQTQPILYTQYSLFVAEVASNFHQAMVRAHLLEEQQEPAFQISLLEEAMSNFHRYFFVMPTLARFELETHRRVEQGQALTADGMNALMADLFEEGYGGEVHVDRDRVGITWATFSHLYVDYYVYQYATGISGAHALAHRVLEGVPGAVDDYTAFLKSGSSLYPLDALKLAGVDLTSPEPVEITFGILDEMVDRLEALLE